MPGDRRLYAAVSGFYALSRLALYLAGVRFGVSYRWQHLHDLDLLKERLWETLFYTHAFTPLLDLVVGVVLKISEQHSVAIYQGLYLALGFAFVNAMAYLLSALRFGRRAAFAAVAVFCGTPPFVYLESFLHYEFPTAALLAVAGVFLHRALATGRWPWFLLFFADCVLVACVRTSFHLVWVLACVGLAALFFRRGWRVVLATALGPVLALVALYAKNLAIFGVFGLSSWVGFNLAIVTTQRLDAAERRAWVREGNINPVSDISLYSGPRVYAAAAKIDLGRKWGVPVLDRLDRAGDIPNYNHWSYLEVSKLRVKDNRYYLSRYPWRYLRTVKDGYVDYFRPTTRWHPQDETASPHLENRAVIGRFERAYNRFVHSRVLPPFGLYVPLLAFLFYGTAVALGTVWRRRFEGCLEEQLILFMAFCSFYVPLLSCLVTIGELERYRFMVEAFMWIVALWAARRAFDAAQAAGPWWRGSKAALK